MRQVDFITLNFCLEMVFDARTNIFWKGFLVRKLKLEIGENSDVKVVNKKKVQ